MAHKIIQWNCRGLRSNYNDLAILLQDHSPTAVCLQETNLKPNTNISFKNYTMVNCFGPANNERACWGVSILVKDGTPHQHITLKTNLQAVAVNINCHRPMTICSVYLPPNRSVDVMWTSTFSTGSITFNNIITNNVSISRGGGCYLHVVPLVTSYRRLNTPSTCLPWVASRIGGRRDPGG